MRASVKIFCVLVGIATLTCQAIAQGSAEPSANWAPSSRFIFLFDSFDGTKTYVDRESILRDGDIVTYWSYYHRPTQTENLVVLSINVQKMNCLTRQFQWLEISQVARDGQGAFYQPLPDQGWHYVIPETEGEAEFNFVCRTE